MKDQYVHAAMSGGVVGEAMTEAEHRVIEELGQKRRLLMAVNESKEKPVCLSESGTVNLFLFSFHCFWMRCVIQRTVDGLTLSCLPCCEISESWFKVRAIP